MNYYRYQLNEQLLKISLSFVLSIIKYYKKRNKRTTSKSDLPVIASYTSELDQLLIEAEAAVKNKQYRYSLFCLRIVLENSLTLLTEEIKQDDAKSDSIFNDLIICENNHVFNEDTLSKLHLCRKICNRNGHDIKCYSDEKEVMFVLDTIRNLLSFTNSNKQAICS